MTVARLMTQTVTILTAAEDTDRMGNTVRGWGTPTESTSKAWIAQQSRSEDTDSRDAEITSWVAFFPPDTVITAADRVRWGDLLLEVDGQPNPASTPSGPHHIEATLRQVAG